MGNTFASTTKTDAPAQMPMTQSSSETATDGSQRSPSPSNASVLSRVDPTDPFSQATDEATASSSTEQPADSLSNDREEGGLDLSQLRPKTSQKRQSSINCRSAFQALNLDDVPYWKNTCKVDIDSVRAVWIYSSYNGNGWWFMEANVNAHVEQLYQKWLAGEDISEGNHMRIGGNDFKYNFDKMAQVNRYTETNRTIRRLDIDKVQDIEHSYAEQFEKSDFVWFYQSGASSVPFMPNYQEELEAAYQDYLDNPNNDDYVHYNFRYSNGYDYQINYRKKTQLNRHTGVRRSISRVPRSEVCNNPEYQSSAGFGQARQVVAQPAVDLSNFESSQQTLTEDDFPQLQSQSANPFDQVESALATQESTLAKDNNSTQ